MTLIEFRSYFRAQLKDVYVLEECDDFLKRLMQAYFKWEPIKIGLDPNYKLTSVEEEKLKLALIELKKERVTVLGEVEEYDYGKFGWVLDDEGNKIELWEPKDATFL